MSRLPIARAEAIEGPVVHFNGEDGPSSIILPALFAQDRSGRWFQMPNRIHQNYSEDGFLCTRPTFTLSEARVIAEKVLEIGIAEDLWVRVDEASIRDYLRGAYALGGVA